MNYYNENDPKTAAWLRELIKGGHIADGVVDERSIIDVRPSDLAGYCQCHFFAGIGGWSYALRLAGWPDDQPVWTGSCPCQPLSSAGLRKGHADERHLWPAFYRLISECHPAIVFGEQVAGKDGREWFSAVRADLERMGYACGASDLCAAGVGAPHIRPRIFWTAAMDDAGGSHVSRFEQKGGSICRLLGSPLIVNGVPGLCPWLQDMPDSIPSRTFDGLCRPVDVVRGYGNAIVPQVAAEFIQASVEAIADCAP